jgi:hypothetical protein
MEVTLTKVFQTRLIVLLAAGLLVLGSGRAHAQGLATAEAGDFLGAWELGLDTPQGAMTMDLMIKDTGGKAVGSISAPPVMPNAQEITDISKDGTKLVLKYILQVQGMEIPAVITLIPDGTKWKANFDFAGGQFNVDGTAIKK